MKPIPLLIPVHNWVSLAGVFHWPAKCTLVGAKEADRLPLGQLAEDLRRLERTAAMRLGAAGRSAELAASQAAVRIVRDPAVEGPGHYHIFIRPENITIAASTDAGAYYAVQTLRDLLTVCGRSTPACVIEDWPDFRRRGVVHDCSRGKVPKLSTLKELVERLARWKINELQLYIENTFAFRRHPAIARGSSPFTPAELRALGEHCKRHHVRLVGALASFGHMEKILSLPRYRHLSESPDAASGPDRGTLCPTDPKSIKFLAGLYKEFVPLFEAEDFNACCDETSNFATGRSSRQAARVGAGRVYLEFLLQIRRLCRLHGKRMNIWADVVLRHPRLLKDVPPDIVMLNWDYNAGGPRIARTAELARAGLPLVVCPGTSAWQTHGTRLANAIANVAQFAAVGRRWDAEGLLNTDWGDFGHRNFLGVSLHGFAHGAAHAWHGRAVDDEKFTETFCFHIFHQRTDRLAQALRTLGDSYRLCGGDNRNSCALYHALVEPLARTGGDKLARIDQTNPAGLQQILEAMPSERHWPKAAPGMDRFEALALEEFAAAAAMDVLACQRALVAKDFRAGKAMPPKAMVGLAAGMREVSKCFAALWQARNKPSRLRDNLALMHQAEAESRRLSRGVCRPA